MSSRPAYAVARLLLAAWLLTALPAVADQPPPARAPEAIIRATVDDLEQAVSACRLVLATDPAALRSLAHRLLRPHLDVLFAGQVILGKWWGEASPDQRRRFAEALYGNLLRRHAPSLLLVTDGMVSIDDSPPPAAGAGEARLAVTVRVPGYAPVPVTLYFRRTGQHWRVFDARVEDFSPLLQLRNLFSAEIRDTGLAAVIRRLESENPPSASPGQRARQCLDRALGP